MHDNKRLTRRRYRNAILLMSVLTVMLTASWLITDAAYLSFYDRDDAPARPHIHQARACLASEQYQCALYEAEKALHLFPGHREALALWEAAESRLDLSMPKPGKQQRRRTYLRIAEGCMEEAKFACAIAYADEVLNIQPGDTQALVIKNGAVEAKRKKEQAVLARVDDRFDAIEAGLLAGRQCLDRKNFDCAEAKSGEVLKLDNNNMAAKVLMKKTQTARRQYKLWQTRIKTIISEAQKCFDDVNYLCTIAKTEAVLGISRRHKRALELNQMAQEARLKHDTTYSR